MTLASNFTGSWCKGEPLPLNKHTESGGYGRWSRGGSYTAQQKKKNRAYFVIVWLGGSCCFEKGSHVAQTGLKVIMLLHQALKGGDSVLRYLWLIPPIDRMLQPTQQPPFPSSPCLPFSFHALLFPSPSLDTLLCTLQEKEGIPPNMTTMKGA